jgi:hypothetical protein
MIHRSLLSFLGVVLAACATPSESTLPDARHGDLRLTLQRVDERFFLGQQCQPTRLGTLSPEEVTGLDELPASVRGQVLENLPLEATGLTEFAECEDAAARLLQSRLHALCWPEVRVTPGTKTRLSVRLGERYRLGHIFVATEAAPKTSPKRILQAAKSAIPADGLCTESTLADMRARVSQLGTFHEVAVVPGTPQEGEKKVPVVIDIREQAPANP